MRKQKSNSKLYIVQFKNNGIYAMQKLTATEAESLADNVAGIHCVDTWLDDVASHQFRMRELWDIIECRSAFWG